MAFLSHYFDNCRAKVFDIVEADWNMIVRKLEQGGSSVFPGCEIREFLVCDSVWELGANAYLRRHVDLQRYPLIFQLSLKGLINGLDGMDVVAIAIVVGPSSMPGNK